MGEGVGEVAFKEEVKQKRIKTLADVMDKQIEKERRIPKGEFVDLYWGLVRDIFTPSEKTLEKVRSELAFSVSKSSLTKIEEIEGTIVETFAASKIGRYFIEGSKVASPVFPEWKYYEPANAPTLGEFVEKMQRYLVGKSHFTTAIDKTSISRELGRNSASATKPVRIAKELEFAASAADSISAVHVINDGGGVDVIAKMLSETRRGEDHTILVSVRSDEKTPRIYVACTCEAASTSSVICKHIFGALASRPSLILGAVDYIATGEKEPLEKHIDYWRARTEEAKKILTTNVEKAAFVYFFTRFLHNKDLLKKMALAEDKVNELKSLGDSIVSEDVQTQRDVISKLETLGLIEIKEVAKTARQEVAVIEGQVEKIRWTEDMDKAREKILKLAFELSQRFGFKVDKIDMIPEWALLLTYGLVMSPDHTQPPVVLHVVGDVGTYKTRGASMVSEYIEIPYIALEYRGNDIINVYSRFVEILSRYIGRVVPMDRIGGIIRGIDTSKERLYLEIDLVSLISHIANRKRGAPLDEVYRELKSLESELRSIGFSIICCTADGRPLTRPAGIRILGTGELLNINDYRMKIRLLKQFKYMYEMDVLNSDIVVLDEASRAPEALSTLLKEMSMPSLLESVRLMILTDNLEPFQRTIKDRRYEPVHDRVYRAVTSSNVKMPSEQLAYSRTRPSVKFNYLELLRVQKFIEDIPVPEPLEMILVAISEALRYKYTINTIDDVKHLRPVPRDQETPVVLDMFSDKKFDFVSGSGGRFPFHVIYMSKFFAFLNRHEHVTVNDLMAALHFTIAARLRLEAETYTDYMAGVESIRSSVMNILSNYKGYIEILAKFGKTLESKDKEAISKEFETILYEANKDPFLAPLVMIYLERKLNNGEIDVGSLPDNVKLSLAQLVFEKYDKRLGRAYFGNLVDKILEYRFKEIKAGY